MTRFLVLLSTLCLFNACSRVTVSSQAEQESGYTYVPLDPFPVKAMPGKGCSEGTELNRGTLLQALPDNAVRMLIEQFDAKGKVSYGPSQVLGQGASYRVTIDYIYSDTKNQSIFVSKSVLRRIPSDEKWVAEPGTGAKILQRPEVRTIVPINASPTFDYVPGSEEYKVARTRPNLGPPPNHEGPWSENYDGLGRRDARFEAALAEHNASRNIWKQAIDRKVELETELNRMMDSNSLPAGRLEAKKQALKDAESQVEHLDQEMQSTFKKFMEAKSVALREFREELETFNREYTEFNIPIYVGLGLRTSSNIYAIKGGANISGLGVIGAEAEANNLKGSLIIQTLGVNGKSVAAALPIQSELNRTTAQNAIVAIGTIKALLHSPETWIAPRVVGLYLPFPGGKAFVNALVSELSTQDIEWSFSCLKPEVSKAEGKNAVSVDRNH